MIEVSYDRNEDLVRVRITGFLTTSEVGQFALDFKDALITARQRTGSARVLVYASNLVQSADVMQEFGAAQNVIDPLKDRAAILANSNLVKMQVQRGLEGNQKAFLSEDAAKLWLAGAEA